MTWYEYQMWMWWRYSHLFQMFRHIPHESDVDCAMYWFPRKLPEIMSNSWMVFYHESSSIIPFNSIIRDKFSSYQNCSFHINFNYSTTSLRAFYFEESVSKLKSTLHKVSVTSTDGVTVYKYRNVRIRFEFSIEVF